MNLMLESKSLFGGMLCMELYWRNGQNFQNAKEHQRIYAESIKYPFLFIKKFNL